jgi:protein O-GlcNAc transferase
MQLEGLHRQGESAEAERLFLQATTLNPCYSLAYSNWGNVLERRKDFPGARKKYLKAIECDPRNALAHHNLGVIAQKEKNLEGASRYYQTAIEADPEFVDPYINLAAILWELGEPEAAFDTLARANALSHGQDGRVIRNWGALLFRAGTYQEAAVKYELVRQTNPNSAELNCLLGLVYAQMNSDDLAVNRFLRCGDLLVEAGKAADAKEAYLKAQKIAPQRPDIARRLGNLSEIAESHRVTTDH